MKTDWLKIKRFFVEGPDTTYRIVARNFNLNYDVVKRHAAKEGWQKDRELFQNCYIVIRDKLAIIVSNKFEIDTDDAETLILAINQIVERHEAMNKLNLKSDTEEVTKC